VIVHCARGVSRSGTVAVAFYMIEGGKSYDDALATVRKHRVMVNPLDGFASGLQTLQRREDVMHRLRGIFNGKETSPPGEAFAEEVALAALPVQSQTSPSFSCEVPARERGSDGRYKQRSFSKLMNAARKHHEQHALHQAFKLWAFAMRNNDGSDAA